MACPRNFTRVLSLTWKRFKDRRPLAQFLSISIFPTEKGRRGEKKILLFLGKEKEREARQVPSYAAHIRISHSAPYEKIYAVLNLYIIYYTIYIHTSWKRSLSSYTFHLRVHITNFRNSLQWSVFTKYFMHDKNMRNLSEILKYSSYKIKSRNVAYVTPDKKDRNVRKSRGSNKKWISRIGILLKFKPLRFIPLLVYQIFRIPNISYVLR